MPQLRHANAWQHVRAPGFWRRHPRLPYLMPAAVFMVVLAVYPLWQLVRMSVSSVTAATLGGTWTFVGLGNYKALIASGDLGPSTFRTLVFVAVVCGVGLLGGLGAALALRRRAGAGGLLLALMVFVWALPPVVNGSVWKFLLADEGLLNTLVHPVHGGSNPIPFLYQTPLALLSVAAVNAWAVIPFNALVFRASLMAVPAEQLEAAKLDGANAFQEFRYVLLPSIRPTAVVLSVLTLVYAFRSFDFIYVMTYGGPGTSTTTLPFLAYTQAFVNYDFGLGSATSVVAGLAVLALAVIYARSVRREESR